MITTTAVTPPPPFTAEQEARVRAIVQEEIAAWYATNLPGLVDRDGKPYSPRQAFPRGVYGYDAVRAGGVLEKRVTARETADAADDTDDAAEAAEQDTIKAALAKPILPPQ